VIEIVKLTVGTKNGEPVLKRASKLKPRTLDVSHLPAFRFPIPFHFKKQTTTDTLPYGIVYPLILAEVQRLAELSDARVADLNLLLGMAVRLFENKKFQTEYTILMYASDAVLFKLEGSRGQNPYWRACVGFPGTCHASESQSLAAQTRISLVLEDERTFIMYEAIKAHLP
jgi:hypothetical protein